MTNVFEQWFQLCPQLFLDVMYTFTFFSSAQTAPTPAKSTCCTQRVKICVFVLCFIGALAVAGVLLGVHLGHIRRRFYTEEKMVGIFNSVVTVKIFTPGSKLHRKRNP